MKHAPPSSASLWAAVTCGPRSLSLVHICSSCTVYSVPSPAYKLHATCAAASCVVPSMWCVNMLVCTYLLLSAFLLDSHLTLSTFFLVRWNLWLPFFFFPQYIHTPFPFCLLTCGIRNVQESFFFLCMHFLQLSLYQGRMHPVFKVIRHVAWKTSNQ